MISDTDVKHYWQLLGLHCRVDRYIKDAVNYNRLNVEVLQSERKRNSLTYRVAIKPQQEAAESIMIDVYITADNDELITNMFSRNSTARRSRHYGQVINDDHDAKVDLLEDIDEFINIECALLAEKYPTKLAA